MRNSAPALYAKAALSAYRRTPPALARAFRPLDGRLVFVLGCPRSGTTFLADRIGSLAGFADIGEVHPLKAAVSELVRSDRAEAAFRVQRILGLVRRLGGVGDLRAVEQTPEAVFLLEPLTIAFPQARFLHLVRDGRDVVCSLLERGWLSAGRKGGDDAGAAYGSQARFWVEAGREAEFAAASDVRRAAWAWRRYVSAAVSARAPLLEVRYERMVSSPGEVAAEIAHVLAAPELDLAAALADARPDSVGRYRRDLTREQLAEVEEEAGPLLAALGYD
jgi:hypothetical protein